MRSIKEMDKRLDEREQEIEKLQQENKQLKEDLRVSQSNEETYSLEMQEITKIVGFGEDALFDDVKEWVKLLNEEHNKKLKVFMAYDFYHSILRDLEECLKDHQEIKVKTHTKEYYIEIDEILDKIQKLKEKYK